MKAQRRSYRSRSLSDHIPHDVIVQVLANLPAKSLMRFTCVCKLWQSVIYNPEFAKLHRKISQTRSGGNYFVTFWTYFNRKQIYLSFKNHGRSIVPCPIKLNIISKYNNSVSISPPLDGLVCLYTLPNDVDDACVLNISTRQIVHLPKTNMEGRGRRKYFIGFDPDMGKYKVLKFCTDSNYFFNHVIRCEIYTLGTSSKRTLTSPPASSLDCFSSSTFVNGTIYWLTYEGNSHSNNRLIAFDVGKEVFRIIKLTGLRPHVVSFTKFCAVGHRLATLGFEDEREVGNMIRLWFLRVYDDEDEAIVEEEIDFPVSLGNTKGLHVSGTSPSGEIVLVDDMRSRNVYLDLKEKKWREKRFKGPQPLKKKDACQPKFDKKIRYNHVENIVRFRDDDCVRNPPGSFLVEG